MMKNYFNSPTGGHSRTTTRFNQALELHQKSKLSLAEKEYRKILRETPRHADTQHMLGVLCYQTERLEEAEKLIRLALKTQENPIYLLNLALTLQAAYKIEEAIFTFTRLLELTPNNPQACNNLANQLRKQYQHEKAIELYKRAIKHAPQYTLAYKNLGVYFQELKRYEEAEPILRQAVKLAPTSVEILTSLASLLEVRKQFAEAALFYRKANDLASLCRVMRKDAQWLDLDSLDIKVTEQAKIYLKNVEPHTLINNPYLTRELHKDAAKDFSLAHYASELARPIPLAAQEAQLSASKKPLKIGYLSSDFYEHATMHLLAGVLEMHDAEKVDIHLYCYSPKREDDFTRRLHASGLPIHSIRELSDRQAAQKIADDNIDILVDLKGYTTGARLGITAYRPAKVIVSWLGYPGSMGHPALADYIIGDPQVTPIEHADGYSEILALMPNSYQPNDRNRKIEATLTREEAGLPPSGIVFCSFNQVTKYSPAQWDVWSTLMKQVPDSVLWLLDPKDESIKQRLEAEFEKREIAENRIIFAPHQPISAHLGRLRLADIALDTFPCNSHTTASDALWAGVPLITRTGDLFAGRVAASLLTAHGFPELVTHSTSEYLSLALDLCQHPEKLQLLRQRLEKAKQHSPLFDTAGFTADLEDLYLKIWQRHIQAFDDRSPLLLAEES
jgi:predicted O-linked N-acetylglucosamine transferase (SPINDLY family)